MLPYGPKASLHYGQICAALERRGTPIGVNDLHIAAHACSEGLTLVNSDQPFSKWENVFSTRAMTVAAVDRLVNHNTLIQINRER
jgi:hypothetical protein